MQQFHKTISLILTDEKVDRPRTVDPEHNTCQV